MIAGKEGIKINVGKMTGKVVLSKNCLEEKLVKGAEIGCFFKVFRIMKYSNDFSFKVCVWMRVKEMVGGDKAAIEGLCYSMKNGISPTVRHDLSLKLTLEGG